MTRSAKFWRLLMIAVVALPVGALLLHWIQSYREATARQTTKARMKQIELALHQYHDEYKTFPPAFVQGPDGRMWHSWRTLLLPYLGEQELAAKYRFDEPWDGPHNRELAAKCPEVFQSPHWGTEPGRTNFYGVIGRRTAWPAQHAISMERALDGTSNTIHVVEGPPVAQWLEPRDLGISDWDKAFRTPGRTGSHVSLMDGAVRYLATTVNPSTQVTLLTPSYGQSMYSGPDWPEDWNESAETSEPSVAWKTKDVGEMVGTDVLAAASALIDPAKNQTWCATSQIAWDELRSQVGGAVTTSPASATADQLNLESFDRTALSPMTYLAGTTGGSPAETKALQSRLQKLFPHADVPLQEIPVDGLPHLRLFACLIKSMPYEEKLERITTSLTFRHQGKTVDVMSFGRVPVTQGVLGETVLAGQLEVGDYISDDNFIMILHTNSKQKDQVILAHSLPGKTLRETWNGVAVRLKSPHPHRVLPTVHSGERLEIPILEFGLSKTFDELVGASVAGLSVKSSIGSATESIRFRLDERGAEILAVAEYSVIGEFGDGDNEPPRFDPTKPRMFVFDQPFFFALREKDASEPYFLGWIAHPEVMVRSNSSQ